MVGVPFVARPFFSLVQSIKARKVIKMKAINAKKRLLDVGIITKNEAENLERCLQCLRPLQEALNCKIIVADTGSTDNSIEVAQQYADEVFSIEWTNDFAEARNKVLDRSDAQWFLTVDTDEFLQDPKELIHFFKSGLYKKYKSAFIIQSNAMYYDDLINHERIEDQEVPRLFYAAGGNRYSGAVHECVEIESPVVRLLDTKLLHYGYYYTHSDEDQKRKANRNARNSAIMEKLLEETPDDLRLLSLAMDSGVDKKKCCDLADTMVEVLNTKEGAWDEPFASPGLMRVMKMYINGERYEDCIKQSDIFIQHFPKSILLCDVWYMRFLAESALKKDYETLKKDFFQYIHYKNFTIKDKYNSLEWVFTGAVEFTNASVMRLAVRLCEKLCGEVTEESTEQQKQELQNDLDAILSEVKLENISVDTLKNWIALALLVNEKYLDASKIWKMCFAYRADSTYEDVFDTIWIHMFYYRPLYVIKSVTKLKLEQSWKADCCMLIANDATDENKLKFYQMVDSVSEWNGEKDVCMLYAISLRHNWPLPLNAFALRPPLMSNAIESATIRTVNKLDDIDFIYTYMTEGKFKNTIYENRWAIFVLRTLFQSKRLDELKQDGRMLKLCTLYKELTNEYWKRMISVDNLTEEELLVAPAEFVSDYYFVQAMEAVESKDWVEAMKRMKAALEQGAILKNIVVALSDYVEEQVENQQEEQVQVADEMYQLAEQMKAQIKNLVAWGETEQAKKALQQLITFCPNDEEAKSLLWVLGAE